MNDKVKKIFHILIVSFFIILFFGGILTELGFIKNPPSWPPNIFMLLGSLIILIFSEKKLFILLLIAGVLGFIYELIGVKSGLLFGNYHYTDVFNIKLFSIPIVMISAWIIILNFTLSFIENIQKKYFILVGAITMVVVDLLIDPVAVHGLNIWEWDNSGKYYGIPSHNFLGWFLLSITILIPFQFINYRITLISRLLSIMVLGFFSIIGFINNIYLASFIGTFTLSLNILLLYKNSVQK